MHRKAGGPMPTHQEILERLKGLGMALPTPPKAVASYVPYVKSGSLIFISGQIPMRDGTLSSKGSVPGSVSIEEAREAAARCALNAVAVLADACGGDLGQVRR